MKASIPTYLKNFVPITLEEMDSVKLLNRSDTKYVFTIEKLPAILEDMKKAYRLLHINQSPLQAYYNVYFDTPNYQMYTTHHNGKVNRHKIRYRYYESTGKGFFEVKFKNNKGITAKKRIPFNLSQQPINEADKFLLKHTPYSSKEIRPQAIIRYTRLTFVNLTNGERITCDYNLHITNYADNNITSDLSHLCIIEVKKDKFGPRSTITAILLKHRIYKNRISKYCIGMAFINEQLKRNRFKIKMRHIERLKKTLSHNA